jgi:hypothetical protein
LIHTTLDVAGHGDTGCFDLAGGDPPRLQGLDAEVAEGDLASAGGLSGQPAAVLLAVLDPARHQHVIRPLI